MILNLQNTFLDKVNCVSLYNRRKHNIRNMFTLRTTAYNLRGNYILTLPEPKTSTYHLPSFYLL